MNYAAILKKAFGQKQINGEKLYFIPYYLILLMI